MATIQVFDPALCCSTGVCCVEVDQQLVGFSADVDWANQNGADIERFNLDGRNPRRHIDIIIESRLTHPHNIDMITLP